MDAREEMNQESCANCILWKGLTAAYGLCQRYPPDRPTDILSLNERHYSLCEHPLVLATAWCAEWRDSSVSTNGTTIFDSTTLGLGTGQVPADSVGNDGDLYINFHDGKWIRKTGGTWVY